MFEVEQNFNLSAEQEAKLLDGATLEYRKKIVDIYYDTPDHKLTLQDFWLRERDGGFELKVPMDMAAGSVVDQYQEIEDEKEISEKLGFSPGSLEGHLRDNGYEPFCTCTTDRISYTKEGFTIVLDEVSFLGCTWTFTACEIEVLVERREDMPDASSRIAQFAAKHGLTVEYLHGKVIEYLMRERPDHFEELVRANMVERPVVR